jgi:hypothetical protein
MPTYNPKDMAYVLQMSKSKMGSAYTPEELALMQDINRNVAGGAMTGMPTGAAMTPQEAQRMAATQQQGMRQQTGAAMTPQEMQMMGGQPQPMNRLAQIQAAANQVLAGGENPEGSRMANIARYFQGRQ